MPQSSSKTLAPPPTGLAARPSKSAMPLPDELLEEVLCRLPPHEAAELVRAALVSRRWCRLASDPGFRRRFREFHRRPPMLGLLCNQISTTSFWTPRFIPTTAFCTPRTDLPGIRVLGARHGRVLLYWNEVALAVWDPITNEVRELPFPEKGASLYSWTAAVLCSAASACDHLDCHHGPFLVVFVCTDKYVNAVVYTYSSDAAAWSQQAVVGQDYIFRCSRGSALVGNAVYFEYSTGTRFLKYSFELCQMSMIQLPLSLWMKPLLLTTTEDGGLGLIDKDASKLYLWSTKDTHEVDAEWEQRAIELKTVFPDDVDVSKLRVIGSGVGIIFMRMDDKVYTIDLKTYKVKKVYEGTTRTVVPYMSFYTPALEAACSGEKPSADGSSA